MKDVKEYKEEYVYSMIKTKNITKSREKIEKNLY